MVHEVVVFLVDVVHSGIFPNAGESGVKVPVDGCSGTPLLKLHCLFSLTRKGTSREGGGGPIPITWGQVNVGEAILSVEDDVVDLVVELATWGFPGSS
ncbi:unnamed protein product [Heligmosomoides polygyrus]|uniref:Secreted protein n=1 Tax=Heligmosomoides polygyrus TaxID=6339 RepID=A0A183F7Y7_HELPZ|nr:unnamed protein product [Heligmosomoides polygyrus]